MSISDGKQTDRQEKRDSMELRAYLEGMGRRWWLFLLVSILALYIGTTLASEQTAQYTTATSILLNDKVFANAAFANGVVQVNLPKSYNGVVVSPAILNRVTQSYPRLTLTQLQHNIAVSVDGTNQLMLITVTDVSPFATADIANYLARHFVNAQLTTLKNQLTYYNTWLTGQINTLQADANHASSEIDSLVPQRAYRQPPPTLTPGQKLTLSLDQTKLDEDNRTLYQYQQALSEVQNSFPLIEKAYVIVKPATVPLVPNANSLILSTPVYQLLALIAGLILCALLSILLDYFMPQVRHQGELVRIAHLSVLAVVPQLAPFEQRQLLQGRLPLRSWRVAPLRLLCASLSAGAIKHRGQTVLLTSLSKRRSIAPMLALLLARKGLRTLLIDANFGEAHASIQPSIQRPCTLQSPEGYALSFIQQTAQPGLFFLPANAQLTQGQTLNELSLLELLPSLQRTFDILLIDGKPMNAAGTHLLYTKVSQVLVLVRKRRDSLRKLQETIHTCDTLKTDTRYVLLT